jgi:hypothetical protein
MLEDIEVCLPTNPPAADEPPRLTREIIRSVRDSILTRGPCPLLSPSLLGGFRLLVLVQIFLSVCFCRANDLADFRPPRPRSTFPER